MKKLFLIGFIFSCSAANRAFPQSSAHFTVDGVILTKDTGKIQFWYADQDNRIFFDTIRLVKGRFHVEGTVNRACEAMVWTDLDKKAFDDPSMFRFMLQPGHTDIRFDGAHPRIKGSTAQDDKESWDEVRRGLLDEKNRCHDTLAVLVRLFRENHDTALLMRQNEVAARWGVLLRIIKDTDVQYIDEHPDSYYSGYLLYQHRKQLSVDSLQHYYSLLSEDVRGSTIGHDVLTDLYPLTDDTAFRHANPLVGPEVTRRLRNTHSIYDLVLEDSTGRLVNLDSCRGKYVVIDFWASWCRPCIENIPALGQLSRKYRGAVQFISISLDRRGDDWKKAMRAHPAGGLQLIDTAAFNSVAAIYCKAIFVPTYIIADPNGRVIRYNAPQAVDAELGQVLDTLVGK